MTMTLINLGRRTRQTLSASSLVPAGYNALVVSRNDTDTTELNSPWDNEWLTRSTEAMRDSRNRLSDRPLTITVLLASGVGNSTPEQKFLTRVLLATAQRPVTTEATESPSACLPDWSRWHELRAQDASGTLSPSDADEFSLMSKQARMLDEIAVNRQAQAIKPVLQEHNRVLASLAQIATLLERAISAAEQPPHLGDIQ